MIMANSNTKNRILGYKGNRRHTSGKDVKEFAAIILLHHIKYYIIYVMFKYIYYTLLFILFLFYLIH
jgi:hypothetical protein